MLIKVTDSKGEQVFINENDIDLVKRGSRKNIHCWRVETGGDVVWYLPCDKNETFKVWLDYQIGGEVWQRGVDRWALNEIDGDRYCKDAKWTTESVK